MAPALTISPAIKVFALLGILVALVMGGAFFVMGGSQTVDASAPLPTPAPKKKVKVLDTPAVAQRSAAAATARVKKAAAPSATAAVAKPKAAVVPKPKAPRKPQLVVAANGLPVAIMHALASHDVVVVSLYGGGWKIDPMARDEAAAGARAAGAGFVALDVTTAGRAAEALMLKYETVFHAPAVLVFSGGGELALQLDGFRDRDTVAQAATNARS